MPRAIAFKQTIWLPMLMVISVLMTYVGISAFLAIPVASKHQKYRHQMRLTTLPSKNFDSISTRWKELEHLIIVPGHSIQWCTDNNKSLYDLSCWFLLDFQRDQVPLFIEHIRTAAKLARDDPSSLLVFSGGQTRSGLGPRSEAQSYFTAAEKLGVLADNGLFDRSITEDFARDSLENLSFSVARFRQITGHLPEKVTVVGFPFKEKRFTELHRKAVKIDPERFVYTSVYLDGFEQENILDSAYDDFKDDIYGCGKNLMDKRASRNPYHRSHGYAESCPELAEILTKCEKGLFK